MKLLEKEREKIEGAVPRSLTVPRSTVKPSIRVNARVVSCPAPRRRRRDNALVARMTMLASLVGLTYLSSTLGGYVTLERARQQARRGEERATYARQEATATRASIEALTNPSILHAWADAHGFVTDGSKPVPVVPQGDTRVAFR